MSTSSAKSVNTSSSDDENAINELRRGPWTMEEDTILVHFIACHGEGRWNLLAKRSGLRRTGKSCRLRWLNYLKPDVKRGNLSPEEQLLILDLHSKWGNRWSKIAQYLPGRTDNEIKNYWRTRVQKQAKYLKIDAESNAFQDIIRQCWIPRLIQKIEGHSSSLSPTDPVDILQSPPSLSNPVNVPLSSVDLMNVPRVSQISEDPSCGTFQQTVNDGQTMNANDTNTAFFEGCSYYNDVDVFGQTGVPGSKAQENLAGFCHVDGVDWAGSDFSSGVWNMDDLWQHKS